MEIQTKHKIKLIGVEDEGINYDSNYETYFGTSDNPITRDVTIIAQTPNYDALLLAKDTQTELELLTTVPLGLILHIVRMGFNN